jgi:hypothetical protein
VADTPLGGDVRAALAPLSMGTLPRSPREPHDFRSRWAEVFLQVTHKLLRSLKRGRHCYFALAACMTA